MGPLFGNALLYFGRYNSNSQLMPITIVWRDPPQLINYIGFIDTGLTLDGLHFGNFISWNMAQFWMHLMLIFQFGNFEMTRGHSIWYDLIPNWMVKH